MLVRKTRVIAIVGCILEGWARCILRVFPNLLNRSCQPTRSKRTCSPWPLLIHQSNLHDLRSSHHEPSKVNGSGSFCAPMMKIAFSYSELCLFFAMAKVRSFKFVQRTHRILIQFNLVFAVPSLCRGLWGSVLRGPRITLGMSGPPPHHPNSNLHLQ